MKGCFRIKWHVPFAYIVIIHIGDCVGGLLGGDGRKLVAGIVLAAAALLC